MESIAYLMSVAAGAQGGHTSAQLHFAEDMLQIIALTFMAVVYIIKIKWILSFTAGKERQAATGDPSTTGPKGARGRNANAPSPKARSGMNTSGLS